MNRRAMRGASLTGQFPQKISAGALPLHPAKGARPSGLPLFFKNKKGKRAKEQREKSSPRTNNHTRPDEVEPIIRVDPAAGGRAAAVRIEEPRPAAQHLRLSIAQSSPNTAIIRRAVVILMIRILTPFPHVSQHVIQAEGVRLESANRRGHGIAVIAIMNI